MSTTNSPICNAFKFDELINNTLQKISKKYRLNLREDIYLRSTYYFLFYKLRQNNNILKEDNCFIEFETLKSLLYQAVQLFKREYETKISHSAILREFKKELCISKKEIDPVLKLYGFKLKQFYNFQASIFLNNGHEISQNIQFILEKFNAQVIPIELYYVLLFDVQMIYLDNDDYAYFLNDEIVCCIVLEQLRTIGKRILPNENNELLILNTPPWKNDLYFNLMLHTFDTTSSLELLTNYFGSKLWYQQFKNYNDAEADEYFSFEEEPYIKVSANKRQYKDISLKTGDTTQFLSNEFQNTFFKIWEDRLKKSERIFFKQYIKP